MNKTELRTTDVLGAVQACGALAEAIRMAGKIPSGHLYAMVCGQMDLPAYNGAIGLLKRAKLVEERGHELAWIGPEIPA